MYSYADRMRVVQLYIKLSKRMAPTLRQLGYPTRNALKRWHREYECRDDLPEGYVRTKPRYSGTEGGRRRALPKPSPLPDTHQEGARLPLPCNTLEMDQSA